MLRRAVIAMLTCGHGFRTLTMAAKVYYRTMSGKTVIHTDEAPAAIGPYSQAIKANGHVWVSGCIGIDAKTGEFVGPSVTEQAEQCLVNMSKVLKAADLTMDHVVKCTVLLRRMEDFPAVNAIYAKHFSSDPPARACYAALGLPKDAEIEIEAIAFVPEEK